MIGGHGREFLGAMRYEFRMQVRRRAVWITVGVLALLFFMLERRFWTVSPDLSAAQAVGRWAGYLNFILPIGVGALLADRLVRDRGTRTDELLKTLPASLNARLWGKYLGSGCATILPLFIVYLIGVGHILAVRHDPRIIPLALAAFATINVPGLLFVAAFSVVVPVVIWIPLYQVLFIGYWFWGNFMDPNLMPTFRDTWLNPLGLNAIRGLFHTDVFAHGEKAVNVTRTVGDGVGSIALLLVCAAIPVVVAPWYLRWRQARA